MAKNWLQGQLKKNQLIFEYSFNTEIVKVSSGGLFNLLSTFFDSNEIEKFKQGYLKAIDEKTTHDMREMFKKIAMKFAEGIAKKAGGQHIQSIDYVNTLVMTYTVPSRLY